MLHALSWGLDPDRLPFVSAERDADGTITLRPPDDFSIQAYERKPFTPATGLTPSFGLRRFVLVRAAVKAARMSYFLNWLYAKNDVLVGPSDPAPIARAKVLNRDPWYESLPDDRFPRTFNDAGRASAENDPPSFVEYALPFMAFGLDQFKARTERAGAALVVLSTHTMGSRGDPAFDLLDALAGERDIPVIDQTAHILDRGGRIEDARWPHDAHWNAAGHRWAAEALMEYLKENRDVCVGGENRVETLPSSTVAVEVEALMRVRP